MTLNYSRFPALVKTSDGTSINRAAVVVIDGHAELAVERPKRDHADGGGVLVIAALDDVTVEQQNRREVILRASDGQTWSVGVGDGCSCRSALGDWYNNQRAHQPMGT